MGKTVDKNGNEIYSETLLHPGEVLRDELEARKIHKSSFAQSLGIKSSNLSEIFSGKRNISPKTAIRLEKLLSINAEYWLRVQLHYDLDMERLNTEA